MFTRWFPKISHVMQPDGVVHPTVRSQKPVFVDTYDSKDEPIKRLVFAFGYLGFVICSWVLSPDTVSLPTKELGAVCAHSFSNPVNVINITAPWVKNSQFWSILHASAVTFWKVWEGTPFLVNSIAFCLLFPLVFVPSFHRVSSCLMLQICSNRSHQISADIIKKNSWQWIKTTPL